MTRWDRHPGAQDWVGFCGWASVLGYIEAENPVRIKDIDLVLTKWAAMVESFGNDRAAALKMYYEAQLVAA